MSEGFSGPSVRVVYHVASYLSLRSMLLRVSVTTVCWQGLTEEKAADRLELYGLNELTPPVSTSEWVKFGRTLVGGFALLLWAGAVLCSMAYVVQYIQMGGSSVPQDYVSSILVLSQLCNIHVVILQFILFLLSFSFKLFNT